LRRQLSLAGASGNLQGLFLVAATMNPLTVIRCPRQCRVDATICAVVWSRTRLLVEMHVSGAINCPESLDYGLSCDTTPMICHKSRKRSMPTFTYLLSLLSASLIQAWQLHLASKRLKPRIIHILWHRSFMVEDDIRW
jgi:hypothetical protein